MFSFIKAGNLFLDILFPPVKIKNAVVYKTLFCSVCRARLPENRKVCHKNSSYKLAAATQYTGDVKKFIWELKYRGKTGAVQPLADVVKKYLQNLKLKIDHYVIIPIPLHKSRESDRGFNQSVLLAKEVGTYLQLPVWNNILTKDRETKPQAETTQWNERKDNVLDCFGIKNGGVVVNKNILLIDDVFTSGATLNEAVKTLRTAGARKIIGLVIAKTG